MTRETIYNDVYDAQRHFRVLLDTMARPGRINILPAVEVTPPASLSRGAAWIALSLLNSDVHFHVAEAHEDASAYLQANTGSRPAPAAEADFLFLHGTACAAALREARLGIPAYPEGGATAVVMVAALGRSSAQGGLALTLTGPGIEHQEQVCITGLSAELLEIRQERNGEFPLGLDFMFVTADGHVACLPRTTRVAWSTL